MAQAPYGDITDPTVEQLFTSPQQVGPYDPGIDRGDLISFNYIYWKTDPYPFVLITDRRPGVRLRGVNINYLTFHETKALLNQNCESTYFSYRMFRPVTKDDANPLVESFRTYKWDGIRNVRKLDCKFIAQVMQLVRSFDPTEIDRIRQQVYEQINRQINPPVPAPGEEVTE